MPISTKVSGVWKPVSKVFVKVAGVWKDANLSTKVAGVWKSLSLRFVDNFEYGTYGELGSMWSLTTQGNASVYRTSGGNPGGCLGFNLSSESDQEATWARVLLQLPTDVGGKTLAFDAIFDTSSGGAGCLFLNGSGTVIGGLGLTVSPSWYRHTVTLPNGTVSVRFDLYPEVFNAMLGRIDNLSIT